MFARPANPISHRLARLALAIAAAGGLLVGMAGPLHRYAGVDPAIALSIFRYGSYIAFAAIALGLATLVPTRPGDRRRGFLSALLALILGGGAAFVPLTWFLKARNLPAIHDISTDLADPPVFVVTAQLRRGAANPAAYSGAETARLQRAGYPELLPLKLAVPTDQAFTRVDRAAMELGWEIVARAPTDGRIEATVRSPWFGFIDDVVIRVRRDGDGSRIDVRSKSRVGQSDLGANAARITALLGRVRAGS